jgi:hypothetical protein
MNTPHPSHARSAMYEIPKYALLAFITSVPFDVISIPQQYATDRQEDFFAFVDAITESLNTVLREKASKKTSPKKALSTWAIREDPSTPTPTYVTPPFSNVAGTSAQGSSDLEAQPKNPNIVRSSNTSTTTIPNLPSWNVSQGQDEDSLVTNVLSIQDLFGQGTLSLTDRHTILQQKTLAGSPLYRNHGLAQDEEPVRHPSVTHEDPRPDITGYEPKSISSQRKRQLRPFMEEMRKTIECNPFMTVDLGKFPNLRFPRIYITGRVEPYEDDVGHQPVAFKELYDFDCWALVDTAADASVICSEYLGCKLALDQRCLAYFSLR